MASEWFKTSRCFCHGYRMSYYLHFLCTAVAILSKVCGNFCRKNAFFSCATTNRSKRCAVRSDGEHCARFRREHLHVHLGALDEPRRRHWHSVLEAVAVARAAPCWRVAPRRGVGDAASRGRRPWSSKWCVATFHSCFSCFLVFFLTLSSRELCSKAGYRSLSSVNNFDALQLLCLLLWCFSTHFLWIIAAKAQPSSSCAIRWTKSAEHENDALSYWILYCSHRREWFCGVKYPRIMTFAQLLSRR